MSSTVRQRYHSQVASKPKPSSKGTNGTKVYNAQDFLLSSSYPSPFPRLPLHNFPQKNSPSSCAGLTHPSTQLPQELHRHLIVPSRRHSFFSSRPFSSKHYHPLMSSNYRYHPYPRDTTYQFPPPISRTVRRRQKAQAGRHLHRERVMTHPQTQNSGAICPERCNGASKATPMVRSIGPAPLRESYLTSSAPLEARLTFQGRMGLEL